MAYNFRGETTIDNVYSGLSGYQKAYQQLFDQLVGLNSDSQQARLGQANALVDVTNQFKSLWTNMVGRAPTEDELNEFLSNSAGNIVTNAAQGSGRVAQDPTNVRNQIAQYVGDTGQQAAQAYGEQQLADQQGKANELADLFRTQGRQAISSTEDQLLDYQNRLFERLRPNLMTSLQAQGLLNTGALNETFAGKAKDLSDQAQQFLIQANLDNENQANAIAYGGASAPYLFKQGNITNQPNFLLQAGQDALNKNTATFMSNLDYQHQLGLIDAQRRAQEAMQPSFLHTFGQSAAQSLGSNFNIPSWISATRGATGTSIPGAK